MGKASKSPIATGHPLSSTPRHNPQASRRHAPAAVPHGSESRGGWPFPCTATASGLHRARYFIINHFKPNIHQGGRSRMSDQLAIKHRSDDTPPNVGWKLVVCIGPVLVVYLMLVASLSLGAAVLIRSGSALSGVGRFVKVSARSVVPRADLSVGPAEHPTDSGHA